ncbi:MAG: DAK2 domain-containing protein [Chloroflexi bacterium]|nr:DAK2 domain-containing protein [Chloroflexota bacterium]
MATVSPTPGPGSDRALDTAEVSADETGDAADGATTVHGPANSGVTASDAAPAATSVSPQGVRTAVEAAATLLEVRAPSVNALNVFPVPDGDTGTNMSMTLRAAAEEVEREHADHAGALAQAAARGALMGARGNSGVILSQLLRGFAEAAAGKSTLSVHDLADGFVRASDAGYRAVGKPVEGTILTVARRAAEEAQVIAPEEPTIAGLLEQVLRVVDRAVADTTQQLDVLASAGVVDAGAQGFRLLVEAFWRTARGLPIEADGAAPVASQALVAAQHTGEGSLGFCTEFMLQQATVDLVAIRGRMESIGDSVIVVGDGEYVRVHVHARHPGEALDWAVDRGIVSRIKVENMQLQHDTAGDAVESTPTARGVASGATLGMAAQSVSSIGVVAVVPGAGFRALFASMGAAGLVEGGQTMNPSVQEILNAVNAVGYQELILLPNNANVLLAARHAATQTPRALRVVPTRSAPQGIAALLAFNYEADLETNARLMEEAMGRVASIEVTRAVRSAEVQGWHVERGQSLGLLDDALVTVSENLDDAALGALARCTPETREIVSIYYGEDVAPEHAEALAASIRAAYPHLEVDVAEGGQPHYPYILSVE